MIFTRESLDRLAAHEDRIWGDARWGCFIGDVDARWLHENGQDRRMELNRRFTFTDAQGVEWDAPKGSVVDGASIPRPLWWLVDPFVGDYRYASVIHDVACQERKRPWQQVHRAFYEAMRCAGQSAFKAWAMYQAVRVGGPRW